MRCVFVTIRHRAAVDVLSHALIGAIIAQLCLWRLDDDVKRKNLVLMGAVLGAAPDIANIPLYLHLGAINERFLWIPHHSDWIGHRIEYPWMTVFWEITHSLLLASIGGYLLYRSGRGIWPAICWGSHGLSDIFAHTGEWATVPLWPIYLYVDGFVNTWKKGTYWWMVSNALLIMILLLVNNAMQKRRSGLQHLSEEE